MSYRWTVAAFMLIVAGAVGMIVAGAISERRREVHVQVLTDSLRTMKQEISQAKKVYIDTAEKHVTKFELIVVGADSGQADSALLEAVRANARARRAAQAVPAAKGKIKK